jgi:hypothetical protein
VRSLAAIIVVAVLGLSAAVAAMTSSARASRIGVSASPFVRACGTDVWGDLGPARRWQRSSVVVGPFAFVWIRQAREATRASIARAYRAGRGAFKILAVIQRGREATVVVPRGERRHVALLYDLAAFNRPQTVANGEQAVTFRACPPSTGARAQDWAAATQFNGGIVVDSPRCVRLSIRVADDGPARLIAAPFGPVSCK